MFRGDAFAGLSDPPWAKFRASAEPSGQQASLGFAISPVTEASAHRAAQAHAQWGKGVHTAALNFGDGFAYALAKEHDCPLLFIGDDFTRTDLKPARGPA